MDELDYKIRLASFEALEKITQNSGSEIQWRKIAQGFQFQGEKVYFATKAKGIFKPKKLDAALSIKTVMPRDGRQTWYSDQIDQINKAAFQKYGLVKYDLSRRLSDNKPLKLAYVLKLPIIYFVGVSEHVYKVHFPVWVESYSEEEASVLISMGDSLARQEKKSLPEHWSKTEIDTSYTIATVSRRNHQSWFSTRVKSAYQWRCALSGLPVKDLLTGAHIIPDSEGGPASVTNGICMSTLHHSAFDSNLIGIDPDYRIHVSPQLVESKDGDVLKSLNELNGTKFKCLPVNKDEWPNKDFLERRFENYLHTQTSASR